MAPSNSSESRWTANMGQTKILQTFRFWPVRASPSFASLSDLRFGFHLVSRALTGSELVSEPLGLLDLGTLDFWTFETCLNATIRSHMSLFLRILILISLFINQNFPYLSLIYLTNV